MLPGIDRPCESLWTFLQTLQRGLIAYIQYVSCPLRKLCSGAEVLISKFCD